MKSLVPSNSGQYTKYRVPYAIHRRVKNSASDETPPNVAEMKDQFEIIGIIFLKSELTVPINDDIATKTDPERGLLRMEIGYLLLPTAWGHGYATEACTAILEACRRSESYFAPFNKLFIEAVASPDNPASLRVLEKAGWKQMGLNEWEGEPAFLAGAWREPCVWVYGISVFE
jgi:hypothetical protein